MITYAYAKGYYYTGDGTLMVRCRIPSIHGPMHQTNANGQRVRNYVTDNALPYYPALLMPHLPVDGEVVAVTSTDSGNANFLVLGTTGGQYLASETNRQG